MTGLLITVAVLLLTIDTPAALRSNCNQQRMMQQLRQQLVRQYQAQQARVARQAVAIAAEKQRRFEMHLKASKARNEKIEADRRAGRE